MKRALGLVALAGFLMSLLAHGAALAGVDVMRHVPAVMLLHVGIFVVFVPLVFFNRRKRDSASRDLLAMLPPWAKWPVVVLFSYAIINFALFIFHTQGGNPTIESGHYLLKSHGRLIREITLEEYTAHRANVIRGFSGHWMIFYFVPFCYFMFARKKDSSETEAQ